LLPVAVQQTLPSYTGHSFWISLLVPITIQIIEQSLKVTQCMGYGRERGIESQTNKTKQLKTYYGLQCNLLISEVGGQFVCLIIFVSLM